MKKLLLIIVFIFTVSYCSAENWKYDEVYKEELLYLHTLVNYDYGPDWKQSWEKELLKGKGIRFNFGSVSASKLLHHEDVVINHDLGEGWWFRTHLLWEYSRYKDIDGSASYLEFQKKILHNLYAGISADVHANKEEIDGTFSLLAVNQIRESYCQLHFCWDDLVYDRRNTDGGTTARQPFGVKWLSRYEGNKWILYTSGKLSAGFKRNYSDRNTSPNRIHHNQKINRAHGKLTVLLTRKSRIESEITLYDFQESEQFLQAPDDYRYANRILHCAVRYIFPVMADSRLDCELHYVNQDADAAGARRYRYRRNEMMPAVFFRRSFSGHTVKAGYLGSFYEWENDEPLAQNDYSRNDYADKLTMGWTYDFSRRASILLSVSHAVRFDSFGGGNVQYMMMF